MNQIKTKRWKLSLRVLGAIGISVALSGCIIEPLYGPHHFYHPYRYGYSGY
jgi:hypothetical protein